MVFMNGVSNIIILGGGFSGLVAAVGLSRFRRDNLALKDKYRIILITPEDFHTLTPAFHHALCKNPSLSHKSIERSLIMQHKKIFFGRRGGDVVRLKRTLLGIDTNAQYVFFENGDPLPYSYLIVDAPGKPKYLEIPGAQQFGYPLKTIQDVHRVRGKLKKLSSKSYAAITIVGGGRVGCELAAELAHSHHRILPHTKLSVTLVQDQEHVLASFHPVLIHKIEQRLQSYGINLLLKTRVEAVRKNGVVLSTGAALQSNLTLLACGTIAHPSVSPLPFEKDSGGRILVDDYLKAADNVFVVGENACHRDPVADLEYPRNPDYSIQQGMYLAKTIDRFARNSTFVTPFKPRSLRYVVSLGGLWAAGRAFHSNISGRKMGFLRHLAQLQYITRLIGLRRGFFSWWSMHVR